MKNILVVGTLSPSKTSLTLYMHHHLRIVFSICFEVSLFFLGKNNNCNINFLSRL
jgi:hypothetical protein